MKTILAIIALVAAAMLIEARAAGDCLWGGLTVGSHHFDKDRPKDYEQQNYGPHGEFCLGREDLRAFGGWERNSKRRDSVYYGTVYGPLKVDFDIATVRAGVALARVSGYGSAEVVEERQPDGRVVRRIEVEDEPLWALFPVLSIEGRRFGANFMYFPKTARNVAVLAWQVKWRFR